jgi:hypothetical protein
MYSHTIVCCMEDDKFSQMHLVKLRGVGVGVGWMLLCNYMHKFKCILCDDNKAVSSAILCYGGLTTPASYCHIALI